MVFELKVFEMEQPNYIRQLLKQLNQQRSKGHLCDMIIVVENALFRAHRNVLAACSSYFRCLVLHDSLIVLNTEMVKPSVFDQVLDFIYTGQLSASHPASNQHVSDLLRAASYLQLSDLAALCRRKLTTSSLTPNGHLHVGHKHHSGSTEVEKQQLEGLQRKDLSEEELFTGRCVSVNSSSAVELGEGVGLELTRKSSPSSSSHSSDDIHLNSTSAFYNPRLELSQRTAAHKRPRSSGKGCLEGSVRTKRQEVERGEPVQAERSVSSELEHRAGVGEEDLDLKNEESGSEDLEVNGNKRASYIYNQLQPRFQPGLRDSLYMCIPCGKGFPSSEQLIAHVDSHAAAELSVKAEITATEDQDRENPPSQPSKEESQPDVTAPRHAVASLRQHERSRWLPRPFSCHICGRLFTQKGTMTRHMRSHLGLKPFACEECGMRFTRQYRKMEHVRIHSREKPYKCHLCGVKFAQQRSIIGHLKMHMVS